MPEGGGKMSKKKKNKKYSREGSVFYMSSTEATLAAMPKYNGHACKSGVHGDTKYNRQRAKRDLDRLLNE